MDVLEAIFTRRSIRKYTGEPISEEDLTTLLHAASYAPSAKNCQPWEFVVVREQETLQAIAAGQPFAQMMPNAGCCIVVVGLSERQKATGFLVEDCSAAIQNILLAAHGLGLGAVWCGLYPVARFERLMKGLLNLPDGAIPVGMVAVGHKVTDRTVEERFDPSRVHLEHW